MNVLSGRVRGFFCICSLPFGGRPRAGIIKLEARAHSVPFFGVFCFREQITWIENCHFIVLFYWSHSRGPQPPMHENESLGCPIWTLSTLTFSVPYLPLSPLSMIHCFLRPFPLHPIDGFQSCFNFQALSCWGDGPGSVSLSYGLRKVTAGERKEAGRAFIRMYCFTFSIHHWGDDSILVKIHWTPIKSDGCYHWRLKSCQAVISTNVGPRDGGPGPSRGLPGIFLVILAFKISSHHFDLRVFPAVLARDTNLVMPLGMNRLQAI